MVAVEFRLRPVGLAELQNLVLADLTRAVVPSPFPSSAGIPMISG